MRAECLSGSWSHGFQPTLANFLRAIFGDLGCSVFEGGVSKASQQLPLIFVQVETFRHLQFGNDFLHETFEQFGEKFVANHFVDMLIATQLSQVSNQRMAAIEQAQLGLLKGLGVADKDCASQLPLGPPSDKSIFDNPLTEGFSKYGGRVLKTALSRERR